MFMIQRLDDNSYFGPFGWDSDRLEGCVFGDVEQLFLQLDNGQDSFYLTQDPETGEYYYSDKCEGETKARLVYLV